MRAETEIRERLEALRATLEGEQTIMQRMTCDHTEYPEMASDLVQAEAYGERLEAQILTLEWVLGER